MVITESSSASHHEELKTGLFSLLVDRPVLTGMITMALVLVGTMSFFRLPLTFMGEGMTSSRLNVFINVDQSQSPREIEDKVARPTEENLRTIPGIKSLRTNCSKRGVRIRVELDNDLDPMLAASEVRDRLQRARLEWPEGVDRYFTWREDGSNAPLQFFQILTPEYTPEWQGKVENIVTPRLEACDGVGRIDIFGVHSEAVRIWFDKDKLTAHQVDYRGLLRRLAENNFTEPAGEIENGSERVLLRVESKFRTLSEIEEFPIRPGLRVKDIARIERDRRDSRDFSRYNGRFTFTGSIRATSDANPVAASARVRAVAEELKSDPRLEGIDFRYLFDQGAFIEGSLNNLRQATFKGGLLALLVLFLFLRNIRATIAIGLAIPLTILIVADYLYFTGDSLNILTMTGMTLAVGMVVDNSVVVLENIRRLRHMGLPLRTACIAGAREVSLAVTMATLTTVVVFLPIIFMGSSGSARALFASLGVPLSVALLASLFVALLLLPSGIRRFGGMSPENNIGFLAKFAHLSPVNALVHVTTRVLRVCLHHRYKVLLASLALIGLIQSEVLPSPYPSLDFESGDKNPFRQSDVSVRMALPRGMSDEDVFREVQNFEAIVEKNKAAWAVQSVSARYGRTYIRLDIQLDDEIKTKDVAEYAKKIREGIPERPGFKRTVSDSGGDSGGAEETDARNFVVRLRGRDSEYLASLGLELQAILEARPEVELCEVGSVSNNQEVQVDIDRDRMQDLGVAPEVLFGTVRGGLQGREFSRFEEAGRDVRIVAQFDDADEPTLNDLRETKVFAASGSVQRIGDLSKIGFHRTLDDIDRVDGRTTVTLIGRRTEGIGPKDFSKILSGVMDKFPLPRGYEWSEHSLSNETAVQIAELAQAGILSIVLVFLLMGILFESVILPLSILITILFATLGGTWALKLFHGAIDPMAIIGLILLAGVVVNNGIVLLDCIERLRKTGMERFEAIEKGVRIRLLPIVMTAATTIVGLLPMAIFGENTGQGVNYVGLSITVSGGLFFCTLVTAPAVSVLYALLDDLRMWLQGGLQGALESGAPGD